MTESRCTDDASPLDIIYYVYDAVKKRKITNISRIHNRRKKKIKRIHILQSRALGIYRSSRNSRIFGLYLSVYIMTCDKCYTADLKKLAERFRHGIVADNVCFVMHISDGIRVIFVNILKAFGRFV